MRNKLQSLYLNVYDKAWIAKKYKEKTEMYTKNHKRLELQKRFPLTVEQKKQIDEYYQTYYGSKIIYDCHQNFSVHTEVFRPDYFADFLFKPFFEHFINQDLDYAKVFEDKSVFPFVAATANVKIPKTILYNSFGVFRDGDYKYIGKTTVKSLLYNAGKIIVKPTIDSGSAKGITIANIKDGIDLKTGKHLDEIIDLNNRQNYVVQEFVKCSQDIAQLYDGCVNTFRIMTYRWKDGFYVMPGVLRIGSGGGEFDNAHAGGMFIAVDEEGVLQGKAQTEFMNIYERHPDSGILFNGYKINGYSKVVDAVLKMHAVIPEIGSIAWDITIDNTDSPLLIEANIRNSGFWIIQCVHACAPFGERQQDILRWIRKMKSLPYTKRKDYAYGYGF